jgi:Zn-dependent metalloprotease
MKKIILLSTLVLVAILIATMPSARRADADPQTAREVLRDLHQLRVENGAAADSVVFDRGADGTLRIMRQGAWSGSGGGPVETALQFLHSHYAALGLTEQDVALLKVVRQEKSGNTTLLTFQQFLQSMPVLNGTIDVVVEDGGVVTRVNNHAVATGTPPSTSGSATQAAQKAVDEWRTTVGQATDKRGFLLVNKDGTQPAVQLIRAREGFYATSQGLRAVHDIVLHYSNPDVVMMHVVDDHTGTVLKTRKLTVSLDATANLFDPNPINFAPLQPTGTFTDVTPDAQFIPRMVNETLHEISTDSNGKFILTGPFARIADIEAPHTAPPTFATTDFTLPRSDPGFDAANAYRAIDDATRFIHNTLGFTSVMNYSIQIDVDGVNGEDNSHYSNASPGGGGFSPGQGYLAFGRGGVPDADDCDIVLHEMGHAIQDNQTNGRYLTDGEAGAMGEGFGDFWAATMTYAQSIASGFNPALVGEWDATAYSSDNPPFLRRVDTNKVYPGDIQNEVHADGEIWSAALWNIWLQLPANEKNDLLKIVLQSQFLVPDSPTFKQGAQALLDANGQIAGIADHRALIRTSMLARGIFSNNPPGNLKATSAQNGVQLTWDDNSDVESSYQVLRGTGNETPALIATLNPNSTSYLDSTTSGGVAYTFQVVAVNPDNPSASPTSSVSITTVAVSGGSGGSGGSGSSSSSDSGSGSTSGGSGGSGSSGSNGGGGGGGGCFIATAAYGTSTEAHVVSLRAFRDHVLMHSAPGRWLVATYYAYSPPIADWIRERAWARAGVRLSLVPVIFAVENPALAGWMVLLGLALTVRLWTVRRTRRRLTAAG